ncbi:MAG TPA: Fic family protein [Steroidobacteraceae bacterium]|nr:Fic family protein [Steroidobacteraceae bacterium]
MNDASSPERVPSKGQAADTPHSNYRPFPALRDWTAGAPLITDRLEQLTPVLAELEQLPKDLSKRAISVVRDAAAIETGAIENLYEIERGITITAATEGAMLESTLKAQPQQVRAIIEAQLRAYDYVLDFVTQKQPIAEVWIRALHEQLCGAQTHYKVRTPAGDVEAPLVHGQYKTDPNHVLTRSGQIHLYAPVNETAPEMQRLVEILRSSEFSELHPIDQAAYAHYAFVAIHPFPDGNGRMARALSSIYTYREYRVPLLVTVDQKSRYFATLEAADDGNYLPTRSFMRDRVVDSILLLADGVRAAKLGSPAEVIQRIRDIYQTRGKYSHVEIDQAGFLLLQTLHSEINKIIETPELRVAGLDWSASLNVTPRELTDKNYRRPISASTHLVKIRAQTRSPAEVSRYRCRSRGSERRW